MYIGIIVPKTLDKKELWAYSIGREVPAFRKVFEGGAKKKKSQIVK